MVKIFVIFFAVNLRLASVNGFSFLPAIFDSAFRLVQRAGKVFVFRLLIEIHKLIEKTNKIEKVRFYEKKNIFFLLIFIIMYLMSFLSISSTELSTKDATLVWISGYGNHIIYVSNSGNRNVIYPI